MAKKSDLNDAQKRLLEKANRHWASGNKVAVISGNEARLLDQIDESGADALSSMSNPHVVDRGGLSKQAVEDSIESLRQMSNPCVVEKREAEALERARSGLAKIVANSYDMSESAASEMSCSALCRAVETYGDDSGSEKAITSLDQNPECGGSVEATAASKPRSIYDLDTDVRRDLDTAITRYDAMKNRTPEHAETIATDALAKCENIDGIEDMDDLRDALV
jgi:hypothetical protein